MNVVNSSYPIDRAGLLPATKPLEMCLYLVRETEIVPWAAALRHLSQWKLILQETEVLPLINAFIQHIIGPIYNTIGWEDKGTHMEKYAWGTKLYGNDVNIDRKINRTFHLYLHQPGRRSLEVQVLIAQDKCLCTCVFRLLRKLILLTAVNSDMMEARDRAVALYKAYRDDETPVTPNLRWIAYSAGVKFGDKEDWKFAWEKYSNSQGRIIPFVKDGKHNSLKLSLAEHIGNETELMSLQVPSEKSLWMRSLADTRNPYILQRNELVIHVWG